MNTAFAPLATSLPPFYLDETIRTDIHTIKDWKPIIDPICKNINSLLTNDPFCCGSLESLYHLYQCVYYIFLALDDDQTFVLFLNHPSFKPLFKPLSTVDFSQLLKKFPDHPHLVALVSSGLFSSTPPLSNALAVVFSSMILSSGDTPNKKLLKMVSYMYSNQLVKLPLWMVYLSSNPKSFQESSLPLYTTRGETNNIILYTKSVNLFRYYQFYTQTKYSTMHETLHGFTLLIALFHTLSHPKFPYCISSYGSNSFSEQITHEESEPENHIINTTLKVVSGQIINVIGHYCLDPNAVLRYFITFWANSINLSVFDHCAELFNLTFLKTTKFQDILQDMLVHFLPEKSRFIDQQKPARSILDHQLSAQLQLEAPLKQSRFFFSIYHWMVVNGHISVDSLVSMSFPSNSELLLNFSLRNRAIHQQTRSIPRFISSASMLDIELSDEDDNSNSDRSSKMRSMESILSFIAPRFSPNWTIGEPCSVYGNRLVTQSTPSTQESMCMYPSLNRIVYKYNNSAIPELSTPSQFLLSFSPTSIHHPFHLIQFFQTRNIESVSKYLKYFYLEDSFYSPKSLLSQDSCDIFSCSQLAESFFTCMDIDEKSILEHWRIFALFSYHFSENCDKFAQYLTVFIEMLSFEDFPNDVADVFELSDFADDVKVSGEVAKVSKVPDTSTNTVKSTMKTKSSILKALLFHSILPSFFLTPSDPYINRLIFDLFKRIPFKHHSQIFTTFFQSILHNSQLAYFHQQTLVELERNSPLLSLEYQSIGIQRVNRLSCCNPWSVSHWFAQSLVKNTMKTSTAQILIESLNPLAQECVIFFLCQLITLRDDKSSIDDPSTSETFCQQWFTSSIAVFIHVFEFTKNQQIYDYLMSTMISICANFFSKDYLSNIQSWRLIQHFFSTIAGIEPPIEIPQDPWSLSGDAQKCIQDIEICQPESLIIAKSISVAGWTEGEWTSNAKKFQPIPFQQNLLRQRNRFLESSQSTFFPIYINMCQLQKLTEYWIYDHPETELGIGRPIVFNNFDKLTWMYDSIGSTIQQCVLWNRLFMVPSGKLSDSFFRDSFKLLFSSVSFPQAMEIIIPWLVQQRKVNKSLENPAFIEEYLSAQDCGDFDSNIFHRFWSFDLFEMHVGDYDSTYHTLFDRQSSGDRSIGQNIKNAGELHKQYRAWFQNCVENDNIFGNDLNSFDYSSFFQYCLLPRLSLSTYQSLYCFSFCVFLDSHCESFSFFNFFEYLFSNQQLLVHFLYSATRQEISNYSMFLDLLVQQCYYKIENEDDLKFKESKIDSPDSSESPESPTTTQTFKSKIQAHMFVCFTLLHFAKHIIAPLLTQKSVPLVVASCQLLLQSPYLSCINNIVSKYYLPLVEKLDLNSYGKYKASILSLIARWKSLIKSSNYDPIAKIEANPWVSTTFLTKIISFRQLVDEYYHSIGLQLEPRKQTKSSSMLEKLRKSAHPISQNLPHDASSGEINPNIVSVPSARQKRDRDYESQQQTSSRHRKGSPPSIHRSTSSRRSPRPRNLRKSPPHRETHRYRSPPPRTNMRKSPPLRRNSSPPPLEYSRRSDSRRRDEIHKTNERTNEMRNRSRRNDHDRSDRGERNNRNDRNDRNDRDRNDRNDRNDRHDRHDRHDRNDRDRNDRKQPPRHRRNSHSPPPSSYNSRRRPPTRTRQKR